MKFIAAVLLVLFSVSPINAQDCAFFCNEEFWYTLDAQSTRDLIAAGADVEERGPKGWVPLTIAAALGDAEMSLVLLEAGADIHSQIDNELSQLHMAGMIRVFMFDEGTTATEAEYLDNMRVLLEYGADVNARGVADITPLYVASGFGTPAVIELLVAAGADLEAKVEGVGTPLLNAVSPAGTLVTAVSLIDVGANVNANNDVGATALHVSVHHMHSKVVALLIDAGADVNAVDEHGVTPLIGATANELGTDNLILLLEAGADVNAVRENGSTALHSAATDTPENVLPLLEAGADSTIRNDDGETAFDLIKGDEELMGGAVYLTLEAASQE